MKFRKKIVEQFEEIELSPIQEYINNFDNFRIEKRKQTRSLVAKDLKVFTFKIGDRVRSRDAPNGEWAEGIISQVDPIKVIPDGWVTGYPFMEVEPLVKESTVDTATLGEKGGPEDEIVAIDVDEKKAVYDRSEGEEPVESVHFHAFINQRFSPHSSPKGKGETGFTNQENRKYF